MSWQEGVAIAVALLGLGAGAFLVARRPSFWIEFGTRLAGALLPLAWRYVSKRMPPEEEAAWHQAERRGQGDEWLRERRRLRKPHQISHAWLANVHVSFAISKEVPLALWKPCTNLPPPSAMS